MLDRHRRIHESTAKAHDQAARTHQAAASFFALHGRTDLEDKERRLAEHERELAVESRRVGRQDLPWP